MTLDGPTNEDRCRYALTALEAYKGQPGLDTGDDHTTIVDLIGDLLHLADEISPIGGWDALESATMHYTAELEEAKEND